MQKEETALHVASSHGRLENVRLLINNGCDVNCRDDVSSVN
jgi:ankyrin repeat protein